MTQFKAYLDSPETATFLVQALEEVKRAEAKHPNWPEDLMYADQIVNEEKGEVTRAVVQFVLEGGSITEVKEELIQVMATCIRMLTGINKLEREK